MSSMYPQQSLVRPLKPSISRKSYHDVSVYYRATFLLSPPLSEPERLFQERMFCNRIAHKGGSGAKYPSCPDGCAAYMYTISQQLAGFSATPRPPGWGYRGWNTGLKKTAGCLIAPPPWPMPKSHANSKAGSDSAPGPISTLWRLHPAPWSHGLPG